MLKQDNAFRALTDSLNVLLRAIKGEEYFVVNQKKTGNKVHCYITPTMRQIMDSRYGGNAPSKMTEQHVNKDIKEVEQMAGIDETVVFERTMLLEEL